MNISNNSVSFTAIKAKGYVHYKDKKPVDIEIKDGKQATITGRTGVFGDLRIEEDGTGRVFGPFARITVDKIDKKSELWLNDQADVPVKLIDTDGSLELHDKAVARVDKIKKGRIFALNDSVVTINSALSGAEVDIVHKAEVVIKKVNFAIKELYSKIKVSASAYLSVKKVNNADVYKFDDGGIAIRTIAPEEKK